MGKKIKVKDQVYRVNFMVTAHTDTKDFAKYLKQIRPSIEEKLSNVLRMEIQAILDKMKAEAFPNDKPPNNQYFI